MSSPSSQRIIRVGGASESWDSDFEFQHSHSDLHLPLSAISPPRNKKGSYAAASPYSHWPNPSELSFDFDASEPTLTRLPKSSAASSVFHESTIKASTRGKQSIEPRFVSHGSSSLCTSSSSASPGRNASNSSSDFRSPTPSLTDWGGVTTATDTELETEGWDELSTEAETEVDSRPPSSIRGNGLQRPKSGLRMPSLTSLFKYRRKSTLQHAADPGDYLPPELRNATAANLPPTTPEHTKIVPWNGDYRSRTNSQTTQTLMPPRSTSSSRRTGSSTPPSRSPKQSIPYTDSTRSSSEQGSPLSQRAAVAQNTSPSAASSRASFGGEETESDGNDTDREQRKPQRRRKLRKRSRASSVQGETIASASTSVSQYYAPEDPGYSASSSSSSSYAFPPSPPASGVQHSVAPQARPPPPIPVPPRRRPLSISLVFAPKIGRSETMSDINTTASASSSIFTKKHRSTASASSIPTSPSAPSFGASLLARARAFSKSGRDRTGPNTPLGPTLRQRASSQFRNTDSSMTNSASMASIISTPTIRPSRTPSQGTPADQRRQPSKLTPTNLPAASPDGRPHAANLGRRSSKPPLQLSPRPMTATVDARPASYYTVSGSSAATTPSGEPSSTSSLPLPRRVSLSDLRIPSRITNAQARIGQDLQRIKDFKAGVEELKDLRLSYRLLVTSGHKMAQPGPSDTVLSIPAAVSAKYGSAVKRIEQEYNVYWECCDVLIDLADGTDEFTSASQLRRDRCVSMFPRSPSQLDVAAEDGNHSDGPQSADERHVELLQQMLDVKQGSQHLKRAKSSQDRLSRPPSATTTPPVPCTPTRASGFSMRDFLRSLKKESPSRRRTSTAPGVTLSDSPLAAGKAPTDDKDDDDDDDADEDWDASSSSSSDQGALSQPLSRARTLSAAALTDKKPKVGPFASNTKLVLSTETMPTLLAYVREVKERCSACLQELKSVTV